MNTGYTTIHVRTTMPIDYHSSLQDCMAPQHQIYYTASCLYLSALEMLYTRPTSITIFIDHDTVADWPSKLIYSLDCVPPATTIVSAVMKDASSDARKAAAEAMSSTLPNLLIMLLSISSFLCRIIWLGTYTCMEENIHSIYLVVQLQLFRQQYCLEIAWIRKNLVYDWEEQCHV